MYELSWENGWKGKTAKDADTGGEINRKDQHFSFRHVKFKVSFRDLNTYDSVLAIK